MPNPNRPELPPNTNCSFCKKELSSEVVKHQEVQEYEMYFCSPACAEDWQQAENSTRKQSK